MFDVREAFQLIVESNWTITSVLVLLGFAIGWEVFILENNWSGLVLQHSVENSSSFTNKYLIVLEEQK